MTAHHRRILALWLFDEIFNSAIFVLVIHHSILLLYILIIPISYRRFLRNLSVILWRYWAIRPFRHIIHLSVVGTQQIDLVMAHLLFFELVIAIIRFGVNYWGFCCENTPVSGLVLSVFLSSYLNASGFIWLYFGVNAFWKVFGYFVEVRL